MVKLEYMCCSCEKGISEGCDNKNTPQHRGSQPQKLISWSHTLVKKILYSAMCDLSTVKKLQGCNWVDYPGKSKSQMCVGISVKCNEKCTFQRQNNQKQIDPKA